MWQLFKKAFMISAVTFGGGYVIVPLLQKAFVEELKWISKEEMLDLVSIAQSSPGAIAINTSVAVGFKMFGFLGAVVGVIATVLPPFLLLMGLYLVYDAVQSNQLIAVFLMGMQLGVCALMIDVAVDLLLSLKKEKSIITWTTFSVAFVLSILSAIPILMILIGVTAVSLIFKLIARRVKDDTR